MVLNKNIALILPIFAMIVLVLLREVVFFPIPDLIPNPDTAWLIYAAKRLAEGQKLYVDIMETNPPLIIWLSLPAVWMGNLLHLNPALIFQCLVTMLNALSVALVAMVIRKQEFFINRVNYNIFIIYIAFGLFMLTPAIYGQREVIFIALVLPYLFLSLANISSGISSVTIILMAAIGFAIKPFFLLLWVMNELALALEKRKITSLFAWHNWLLGTFQLGYLAAIYFVTPEYITDLFPALMATYFSFKAPWHDLIIPIAKVVLPVLVVVCLTKISGEHKRIASRVLVWLVACIGLILLQRKDWLNHLYPMLFMAGLLLSLSLSYLIGQVKIFGMDIGHRKFTSLCLAVSLFMGIAYLDVVFSYSMFTKPSKISMKLMAEIENKAAGKYIYPLVNNIQPSFPAIILSSGVFRGGFHHSWPFMGIVIREQQGDSSPEFTKAKKWFIDTLVRDFTNYPPELVWVNENVNMEMVAGFPIKPENRDFIAVLSRDERFAKIWRDYKKYTEIESELYPDELETQSEEDKLKKPERISLYIRKKNNNE